MINIKTPKNNNVLLLTDELIMRYANHSKAVEGRNRGKMVTVAGDFELKTHNKKATPGGLYDPYIFDLPDHCNCSAHTRYKDKPVQCKQCRVWVVSPDDYLSNYSYWESPVPYINFLKVEPMWRELEKVFGKYPGGMPKKTLENLWSLYVYIKDTEFTLNTIDSAGDEIVIQPEVFFDGSGQPKYVALSDLPGESEDDIPEYDLVGDPIDIENVGLFGLKKLGRLYYSDGHQLNKISDMINFRLVVTSPGRRPAHKLKNKKTGEIQLTIDQETLNYYGIMNYGLLLEDYKNMENLSITDKATYCWFFNVIINSHFQTNNLLQSSKQSLTRTILDTRVNRSMRALITAAIDIPMDTVGLPETAVYKMLQKEIIDNITKVLNEERNELIEQNGGNVEDIEIPDAKQLYLNKDPKAIKIFREMIEPQIDENGTEMTPPAMCILVRNPTLHRHNLIAYKIKLLRDERDTKTSDNDTTSIHLPIAVDEGYNADH